MTEKALIEVIINQMENPEKERAGSLYRQIERSEWEIEGLHKAMELYQSLQDKLIAARCQRDIVAKMYNDTNPKKLLHYVDKDSLKWQLNIRKDISIIDDLARGMSKKDVVGKWLVRNSQPYVTLNKKMKSKDFIELLNCIINGELKYLSKENKYYSNLGALIKW